MKVSSRFLRLDGAQQSKHDSSPNRKECQGWRRAVTISRRRAFVRDVNHYFWEKVLRQWMPCLFSIVCRFRLTSTATDFSMFQILRPHSNSVYLDPCFIALQSTRKPDESLKFRPRANTCVFASYLVSIMRCLSSVEKMWKNQMNSIVSKKHEKRGDNPKANM